jgi:hypothetical protein
MYPSGDCPAKVFERFLRKLFTKVGIHLSQVKGYSLREKDISFKRDILTNWIPGLCPE